MLPIAQIGSILSQNQWTEELPHDVDDSGKAPTVKFCQPFLPPSAYSTDVSLFDTKVRAYIHLSEQIPSNHSTDIDTPPPDCMA